MARSLSVHALRRASERWGVAEHEAEPCIREVMAQGRVVKFSQEYTQFQLGNRIVCQRGDLVTTVICAGPVADSQGVDVAQEIHSQWVKTASLGRRKNRRGRR